MSIKNARFKCQPSISRATLCIKRCTPFMENDDKKGEVVQRYEIFLGSIDLDMDMDKERATLKKVEG